MAKDQPKKIICVLILQYNSADLTLQLLESLILQEKDHLHRYRIVVMDNASDNPERSMLTNRFPFIEFVQFEKNHGFAVAHNLAMKTITEDWVLLLNNDCILVNDAINQTFTQAAALGADFATCQLLNDDHSPQINFSTAPTPLRRIALNGSGFNRLFLEPIRLRKKLCRVGYINGAFLLLRVDRIPPPTLFDARYFMYTEDLDLMIRYRKHQRVGLKVRSARAIHLGGASAARAWGDGARVAQKFTQAKECMGRHFPAWQVYIWSKIQSLSRVRQR